MHAAAARRRLRPLLQQGRVRGGRHHRAAQDPVGVRGRRDQADQDEGRLLLAARLHAELPRLRDDHDALRGACGARRTSTTTASRPSPPTRRSRRCSVAEGAGRQARRLRQAGEVPHHLRRRVGRQEPVPRPARWRCRSTASGGPASSRTPASTSSAGVAPFPVPDDQADTYGKGYLSGTIIGIASTSEKQNAAWELVKYMTTDTDAVVSFANAIHNVPSTLAALKSPDLDQSEATQDVHRDRPEPRQQHHAGQPQRRRLPADAPGPRLRRTSPAR